MSAPDGVATSEFQEELSVHKNSILALLNREPSLPDAAEISSVPSKLGLSDEERHRVLLEWNATHIDYPLETCLHDHIEAQSSQRPDAVAVVFQGESLTYDELDRRTNQLARHLRSLGVGPNVLVAISMERSLEMVVALLATLKAGGAYVPIDPEYPQERIDFMLGDAKAAVLLTQERLRKTLRVGEIATFCLDTDWERVGRYEDTAVERSNNANDLAYVIYTSGSTGQPKGAMNAHRGICNRLLWMQDQYRLTEQDVVLQKTPFSFDVSVWEFFWPLMAGARLVLAKPGGQRDNRYLVDLIERERVTIVHFVPSMLRLFLEEPDLRGCKILRDVICSGEALTPDLQQRFFERLDARLHNLYGPTEAAVDVTYWTCPRGWNERSVPIGRPVANTTIYILDSGMKPVPIGQEGELHIGGVQVGRGYLNRPELTEQRFVPDPFSPLEGARLYKTGDLARHRPDGNVEFLGRIDHQVKIRGFRVELGEIEHVAETHPDVKQCVVMAREGAGGAQRLVAYLVAARNVAPGPSELRSYLEARLPDYMLPSVFITMDAFPLSPSGKVDRKALPAPGRARPKLDRAYVAPRNELEGYLTRLWSGILEIETVGIHDRFFELGGTSLQAARFVNELREDLGEFIYVVTIFDKPTIAAYAQFLSKDYAAAVGERFPGVAIWSSADGNTESAGVVRITADDVERIRAAIPTLIPSAMRVDSELKNPPALFILAPPRSGTTLLRVMLAGHPKFFAAAELQLLGFNNLAERKEAFTGKYSVWLEGTLRAVMEIRGCDADEAKRLMAQHEERGLSTKAFYRMLQDWLGDRMLVDKSPAYATDLDALKKAEADFESPLYIHLARHPYSVARSFESYHMEQVIYVHQHPFSSRQLAELIWTVSHQNILRFFEEVPESRRYFIRYEELVTEPEKVMRELCRRFSIDYHQDLTQPYKNTEKKMTDGVYAQSTPMGDTRFLEHQRIRADMAERWKEVLENDFLGDVTWRTAERLGYERAGDQRRGRRRRATATRRRSSDGTVGGRS